MSTDMSAGSIPGPLDEIGAALADAGLTVRAAVPVGPLTTYRVGGPAAWLVEVGDAGRARFRRCADGRLGHRHVW